MNNPKDIRIADFAYELPDERIAKYPLAQRDASKLLVYDHGDIREGHFIDLPDLLPEGSLLVMNNTRVIQARLHFRKAAPEGQQGALIEVFCLEPAEPRDYQLMFQQTGRCTWHCLLGNAKKWKAGTLERSIVAEGKTLTLTAERLSEKPDKNGSFLIRFSWADADTTWAQVLDACGELPIPPYLNRSTEESDLRTYQTVYSKVKGSVAAPTAGLHFTPRVLEAIDRRGIERAEVTLHVGAGTFKPVKSEHIAGHEMHSEWISVPRSVVEALLRHDGTCTAVGTTSVRTLESLYYIGRKLMQNPHLTEDELKVGQWEPYEGNDELQMTNDESERGNDELQMTNDESERGNDELQMTNDESNTLSSPDSNLHSSFDIRHSSLQRSALHSSFFILHSSFQRSAPHSSPLPPLQAILAWMDANDTDVLRTSTQIIIAPGYEYHIVRRMVTNFHQPQSTLLLLVSAFVGDERWRDIYRYALDHDFRFLSYGDSSLLMP